MYNGAGRTHRNKTIMRKQLAAVFSDFNEGLIIRERINKSFLSHESNLKYQTLMQYIRIRMRIGLIHDNKRLKIWYNPCIIRQYIHVHSKTQQDVLFSNSNIICQPILIVQSKKVEGTIIVFRRL